MTAAFDMSRLVKASGLWLQSAPVRIKEEGFRV